MKRLLISLLILYLLPPLHSLSVTALANGEWPLFIPKAMPHFGYASYVVGRAFELVGIEVHYEFYPWARAEELVKSGNIDGSLIWRSSEERLKYALFSDPIRSESYLLFSRKDFPIRWESLEDLYGLSIGVPLGSYPGILNEGIGAGEIELVRTMDIESGFRMVLAGRIDAHALSQLVAEALLRRKFSSTERAMIDHSPKALEVADYCLMLSSAVPKNRERLKEFNKGLRLLKESDELDRMQQELDRGLYDRPAPGSHSVRE